jgi:DNA polymerase I
VCFVSRRDSDAGALTRYFGKVAGREEYKLRGIEARQRSTPPFIADLQRSLIRTLDRHRDPEPVCDRLARGLGQLTSEAVPPEELLVRTRVSKSLDAYDQHTQTVAALERAHAQGLPRRPGQDVEYLVVDDDRRSRERVRLAHESLSTYDTEVYADLALRAGESVLAPLGWDRRRIQRQFGDTQLLTLASF